MGTRIFLSILCYALSIFIVGACMLDTRGKVLKFAAAIGAVSYALLGGLLLPSLV